MTRHKLKSFTLKIGDYCSIPPASTFDWMRQGRGLVCSRYLARPKFCLCQRVDGGDGGAIERAPPGAYSVTFILHSWGRKATARSGYTKLRMDISRKPGVKRGRN